VVRDKGTIPKKELKTIMLAVRWSRTFSNSIKTSANNLPIIYLTDSQIALAWIKKPKPNKIASVEKLVKKIQPLLGHNTIKYIGPLSNPADYLTRETNFETLQSSQLWWTGPSKETIKKNCQQTKSDN
jgi:GH25 family lysozyme M1 (1,4-beta-N-acetylmuramidase)